MLRLPRTRRLVRAWSGECSADGPTWLSDSDRESALVALKEARSRSATRFALTPEERASLIDTVRASEPHSGICGVEVCQLCGELGSFSGFAYAYGSHFVGNEFVGLRHDHHSDERTERYGKYRVYGGLELGRVRDMLDENRVRFCEVCRRSVPRSEIERVGVHPICAACLTTLRGIGEDPHDLMIKLIVYRYGAS